MRTVPPARALTTFALSIARTVGVALPTGMSSRHAAVETTMVEANRPRIRRRITLSSAGDA
jgi:hypothetical protein